MKCLNTRENEFLNMIVLQKVCGNAIKKTYLDSAKNSNPGLVFHNTYFPWTF